MSESNVMVSRERLVERLASYETRKAELIAQANACAGGIENCQQLINEIDHAASVTMDVQAEAAAKVAGFENAEEFTAAIKADIAAREGKGEAGKPNGADPDSIESPAEPAEADEFAAEEKAQAG